MTNLRISHKLTLFALFACMFVLPAASSAAEAKTTTPTTTTFPLDSDPSFKHYRVAILRYLTSQKARSNAEICALGQESADGTRLAWVIWNAGRVMILWDGGDQDLRHSRRIIRLNKDVVTSDADVLGSTYLVTKTWAHSQEERCEKFGTKVILTQADLSRHRKAAMPPSK